MSATYHHPADCGVLYGHDCHLFRDAAGGVRACDGDVTKRNVRAAETELQRREKELAALEEAKALSDKVIERLREVAE